MFNKIYLKDSNLRPHLEAPLLKEREKFVSHIAQRGYCLRYQQMVAEYLLFAVRYLGLKDEDHSPVNLSSIWEMGQAFRQARLISTRRKNFNSDVDTKYTDQMFYTVTWLKEIDMLDHLYCDSNVILNKLMVKDYYRLKYLSAPLLNERESYLKQLLTEGYCLKTTIREAAEMQLVIIEMLNLTTARPIHISEIDSAFSKWDSLNRGHHCAHSEKARKQFYNVAFAWLHHAGMLKGKSNTVYEKDKIDDYCQWLHHEKGLTSETISGRMAELYHLTEYLHKIGESVESCSPSIIDGYLSHRSNEGCNRRSIASIVTCLRDFFRYAAIRQWTITDFSNTIHGPRLFSHENIPYAPDWEVVEKLVEYYDGTDATSIRNRAIILLLVVYGLRTTEVAELRLGDIDWINDTIVINHKKRGRSLSYPLLPEVGNAIVKYLRNVRRNDWNDRHLFLTMTAPIRGINRDIIYMIVANAYKGIGASAKHVGGHSLRHACASKLINSGLSLKTVSDVLGHRSLDSTRVYTKIDLASSSVVSDMNWEGLI